ncbi:hypothetical protein ACWDUI_24260 [Streptosporangium sandarakinum]
MGYSITSQPGPTHAVPCQPWCTDHFDGDGRPEEGYCRRRAGGDFADVYLSGDTAGEPVILAYQRAAEDELSPARARAYALALLALADAAEQSGRAA